MTQIEMIYNFQYKDSAMSPDPSYNFKLFYN